MGHFQYEIVKRYVPDKYNNAGCGCGCGGCGCLFWSIVLIIVFQVAGCIVIKPIAPHWPFVQVDPANTVDAAGNE